MAVYKNSPPLVISGSIFHVDFLNEQSYISGSTTVTSMINQFTGSLSGSIVAFSPVLSQGALFFTGSTGNTGGIINFGTIKTWPVTPNTFSLFGLCRRVTGSTSQVIACKDDGGVPSIRDFQLQINAANQIGFTLWNSVGTLLTLNSIATVPVGSWNYVGGTWDGVTMRTYLNGIFSSSGSLTTPPLRVSNCAVQIGILSGSGGLSSPFNGSIAVVHAYNRGLSQAEITQNYNALKSRYNLP
jgi:hypothetical protein